MIEPKEVDIGGKIYIISKFPAIAGREIISKYPLSGLPKIGDYQLNEETMIKLMSYVAVPIQGSKPLALSNKSLIDNHVPDWEILAKIEMSMMEYNCSFFRDGRVSTFLNDIAQKLPSWITKMLTDLSPQSSPKGKRRSTS